MDHRIENASKTATASQRAIVKAMNAQNYCPRALYVNRTTCARTTNVLASAAALERNPSLLVLSLASWALPSSVSPCSPFSFSTASTAASPQSLAACFIFAQLHNDVALVCEHAITNCTACREDRNILKFKHVSKHQPELRIPKQRTVDLF